MQQQAVSFQQILSYSALMEAWKKVRANRGAAGLDGVTIRRFEEDLEARLNGLVAQLEAGSYLPMPPRQALIPKRNGQMRSLGILSVEDRIVQRAVLDALEPVCEDLFLDCSFGYRPRRSIRDAAKAVLNHRAAGYGYVVDADIEDFFGSLDHGRLQILLQGLVDDSDLLRLFALWLGDGQASRFRFGATALVRHVFRLKQWAFDRLPRPSFQMPLTLDDGVRQAVEDLAYQSVEAGVRRLMDGTRRTYLRGGLGVLGGIALAWSVFPVLVQTLNRRSGSQGILQGAPISPLLANVYLHAFDEAMMDAGYKLVRYADDFVILCDSQGAANQALEAADRVLEQMGLRLNQAKTGIVSFESGFEFLGYTFLGDCAQMGDDAETKIQIPKYKEAMHGLGRTVQRMSPNWANGHAHRLVGMGRRLWQGRNGKTMVEIDDADTLR